MAFKRLLKSQKSPPKSQVYLGSDKRGADVETGRGGVGDPLLVDLYELQNAF